jgi:hypothetical protein
MNMHRFSYFYILVMVIIIVLFFNIFPDEKKESFIWERAGPGWGWNDLGWNGWRGRRREVIRRPVLYEPVY